MSVVIITKPTVTETIRLPRKLKPDEARRVERLGKLNDRRKQASAAGDARTLLKIAEKYEKLGKHGGCPRMANALRIEAEHIQKGRMQ